MILLSGLGLFAIYVPGPANSIKAVLTKLLCWGLSFQTRICDGMRTMGEGLVVSILLFLSALFYAHTHPPHICLPRKVSVLMGYDSLHDLIENERVQKESDMNLKDEINNVDISLACRKFPSIILGNSPPVELYDENKCHSDVRSLLAAQICEEFLSSSGAEKWDGPDRFSETWPSLCPTLPNINASLLRKESSSTLPVSSQPLTMETKEKSDVLVTVEGPPANMDYKRGTVVNWKIVAFTRWALLRKLLQHFPRTYADLKNALIGIDDGQYMISIGKILSSRGVKASCSFSFLEVVVGCEIADCESKYEQMIGANDSWGKKTIYLHLKKFFRGTRFTNVPFLRCLQEKHKEGDIVCVSGKVRTMRTKDHYEMREYNLDLIEDDQDSSVCPKGRPYSIYPSKGGLNSNFLRDIISRALHSLPVNIDPIPKDIIEDFGLLSLHSVSILSNKAFSGVCYGVYGFIPIHPTVEKEKENGFEREEEDGEDEEMGLPNGVWVFIKWAYVGIHQPKDLKEADLARKRLIFDEFFYLQLGRLFQILEGLGTKIEKDGLLDKYRKPELNTVFVEEWSSLTKNFLKALPYSLTSSQLSAASEIIWDLKRPVPMNRLLQDLWWVGDAGLSDKNSDTELLILYIKDKV
ncbi:ATP-dependent DNA helicase-like RECG, chloroplastic [Vitis vinifera]|uniref:ATP-dependent DNA helicase-like RECG, chloroplastic n=1 Tax=Vitis vinifera TaxID=29760 RepID=A0A438C1C6_VITVI|nr:ATP-dependent DNA helicase-like RECG, chloroplastic [Vitis vinifera]